jgi:mRNA interferase HigB
MRVISKKPIREFWERHPESKPALEEWFRKISQLAAASFPELRQAFRSADYVEATHYSTWAAIDIESLQ